MIAKLLRIRRLGPDQSQPRHPAAFLVDRDDRLDLAKVAQIIDQLPQLRRTLDIAAEKNESARLNPAKKRCRLRIQFVTRNTSEDQLAERCAFHEPHFTFRVELRNRFR